MIYIAETQADVEAVLAALDRSLKVPEKSSPPIGTVQKGHVKPTTVELVVGSAAPISIETEELTVECPKNILKPGVT